MHRGQKRNMNRHQKRPFAGRSQRPPPTTPRGEPQGSHNARRSYDRYMALAQAELQCGASSSKARRPSGASCSSKGSRTSATRRRVLRLGSAPARDSSGPCRDHCQMVWECRGHSQAATVRFSTSPALTAFGTCRTSQDVRLGSAKWVKADIDQVAVIAIL